MRPSLALFLALGLAPALQAQRGPAIVTSTDYGVLATDGQNTDFDAKDIRTPIGRGLHVAAHVGDRSNGAFATTAIAPAADPRLGAGVRIHEHGAAFRRDPNGGGMAGTSDSSPSTRQPSQGAHGIAVAYQVAAGATGKVKIFFGGDSSQNAAGGVAIDVDGDGQADFSARANGQPHQAELPVTAGRRGVILNILTSGQVTLRGAGHEGYGFGVSVFFKEDTGGNHGCAFTSFGRDCGAHLDGQVVRSPRGRMVQLDLSQAVPLAFGLLVVGDQLASPMALPFSRCHLLVDPRGALHAFLVDRSGAATLHFPLPNAPRIDMSFQVVTLGFDPQHQASVDASNGQQLLCR